MAVLWQANEGSRRLEVRSAGASRRLYADGVLHSQYHPAHIVTGGVWDLLSIPAFFLPKGEIEQALVLGVGGGAVIHQLRAFCNPQRIVGVELSALHLEIAKRFFGLRFSNVELICHEAQSWVAAAADKRFDLVVEDLFAEVHGEPERAIPISTEWLTRLADRLSDRGILVMNCVEREEIQTILDVLPACIDGLGFCSAFRLTTPGYGNEVIVLCRRAAKATFLRRNLRKLPQLDTRRRTCRLQYRIRSLGSLTVK